MKNWILISAIVIVGILAIISMVCMGFTRPPSDVQDNVILEECDQTVDYHARLGREDSRTLRFWYAWCRENMPDSPYYESK